MSRNGITREPTPYQPVAPPGPRLMLRRKCACGKKTAGEGTCDACSRKDSELLRRAAVKRSGGEGEVPQVVHDVLRSPGRPLDTRTRVLMESRLGHDFGGVRVHTDERASESARAVDALAYTVGNRVVFGAGQYAPGTATGSGLLSHELTHVAQSGGASPGAAITMGRADSPEEHAAERNESAHAHADAARAEGGAGHTLRRKGASFGGFFANIGRAIASIFTGDEVDYGKETLDKYLQLLRDSKEIEDDFDSDNKARDIVERGLFKGETTEVKTLLVREMITGVVWDADEQAIIKLLELVSADERTKIADAITYEKLHDKFDGAELDKLYLLLPKMQMFQPRGADEVKSYSFEDYIKKWEKETGTTMTPAERNTLARGCIGISALNLGTLMGNPDLNNCYNTFEQAWNASQKMNAALAKLRPGRKTLIFSKRFWAGNEDFTPDPKTGEVDMSKPHPGRPGFINFDYGLYDETTGKWWHANHCDSRIRTNCVDPEGNPMGVMTVFESNLQHYSRDLADFDKQVFCVAVSTRT
jgi:hypothetical protein